MGRYLISAFNMHKGGSLRILENLLKNLPSRHVFFVLVPSDQEFHCPPNARLIRINYKRFGPLSFIARLLFEHVVVATLHFIHRCDTLLMMGNFANVFIRRQFVYFHNDLYICSNSGITLSLSQRVERVVFRLLSHRRNVVYITQSHREFFSRKTHVVVKMPFESALAAKSNSWLDSADQCEVIYPAFFYPNKNHRILLSIAHYLRITHTRIWVTLPNETYKKWVGGFADCFPNLGVLAYSDVASAYDRMHALVFPSLVESFGFPLMEAMSRALPIVVADREYAHSLLGPMAYYFDPADPDSLVLAFEKLREDKSKLVDYSREIRSNFCTSWHEYADLLIGACER